MQNQSVQETEDSLAIESPSLRQADHGTLFYPWGEKAAIRLEPD